MGVARGDGNAPHGADVPGRHFTRREAGVLLVLLGALLSVLVYRHGSARGWWGGEPVRVVSGSLGAEPPSRLDANHATAAELELLPGIGPVLARAIVSDREEHGAFRAPRDLLRVPGIGDKTLDRLLPHLAFPEDEPPARPAEPPTAGH
ncbi:MAG: helix-hairpin-helix domain-containing protein [Planctomycetes bacterium]|nr:helix-hairpin-helix domain-containing protein [Planctomycetota bacterium]